MKARYQRWSLYDEAQDLGLGRCGQRRPWDGVDIKCPGHIYILSTYHLAATIGNAQDELTHVALGLSDAIGVDGSWCGEGDHSME